jgi:predicted pyridoxine 5'-phosphate oxidase superfamily flavin-nucleotide-binding protein
MVTMPEELIQMLTRLHTVPVATTGPDGMPNVAVKSVMVINPETIVWGELYFMQTYENLTRNPRASICVWQQTPPFRAYKVNGRVTIHEHDELAAQLDERMRTGHGIKFEASRDQLAAVYFTVEEVYDQTPDVKTAGKRIA